MLETIKGKIFGEKVANSETRHCPSWLPKHFDKRWLGERFAVMDLPPYKPPYKRHARYKAWVCMGPDYIIHLNVIAEIDLDERALDIQVRS